MTIYEVVILLLVGAMGGILSGVVGVGGGVILVPSLVFFLGFSQHTAQGTSLAMMVPPVGILAVLNYYQKGHVNIKVAAILCCSFIAGSYIGSKIAIGLTPTQIKRTFGCILFLVSIKFILGK
ncbi:MAG: sulfite exporter TauE/SafE family protein [Bacteroidia bacterium]|nr:sulfite exporter TauE/SafE family protein [Bacteroidia bacterium]